MKIDQNKKQNCFTQRTLEAFSTTIIELLCEMSFENITINLLCKRSNYPRSTFYNYFEDIFDLMNYCFDKIANDIKLDDYEDISHEERTFVLFERLYSYMESKQIQIDKILAHNNINGKMLHTLNQFIQKKIYEIMIKCPESKKYPIPFEILVEQYSRTLQLILDWCFFRKKHTRKDDALKYLYYLIGSLEKEMKLL